MKVVTGTFNGTGAAVFLCLGFIPDFIKLLALEDDAGANAAWNRDMRAADCINGILDTNGATALSLLTAGNGFEPYEGGEVLTAAMQTSADYGEGVYLAFDKRMTRDERNSTANGGSAVTEVISTWTLDTAGNRTGHFNEDVASGGRIGEGSKICIDGVWYTITALTAGQGEAANEVTLDRAAPSGVIEAITPMYDLAPLAVGDITPAGIKCNITSVVNVDDEMQMFIAGTYDN
jgi:hypothetical protein